MSDAITRLTTALAARVVMPVRARLACAVMLVGAGAFARLAAQCPDGTPPPCRAAVGARSTPRPMSIAVLPFENRSTDSAEGYLAEGMTEEIANRLTRIGRLQVRARGQVAAQSRRSGDALEVARRLDVAWFVHGNVRRVSGQLLVNVELVRALTGEEAWASRFSRRDADVFAVQAEVAESVAVVVGGRLSPVERAVIARRPTRDNEAYRLYLYANAMLARRTLREGALAVEAYSRAVKRDSGFAGAWARLGVARGIQAQWGWEPQLGWDSLVAMAFASSRRALALDSLSVDAWMAMGYSQQLRGRLDVAHLAFDRAIRLDSLNADAYHMNGALYSGVCGGDVCLEIESAAMPLLRRAVSLDPTLRNTWRHIAAVDRNAGRLPDAEAHLDTSLSYGPWQVGYSERARVRLLRGNQASAQADVEASESLSGSRLTSLRASIALQAGDSAPARTLLEELRATPDSLQESRALVAMALGLREEAVAALEQLRRRVNPREPRCAPAAACSAHLSTWLALQNPEFRPLHADGRFRQLWEETRPRVPWLMRSP